MKLDTPVPYERLAWFQTKLGLAEEDLRVISTYQSLFLEKKEEFAEALFEHFHRIPESRAMLEHEGRSIRLKKVWAHWYQLLFKGTVANEFLTYIWRSGLRHVEIGLDQRFINLAYSFSRQFLQKATSGLTGSTPNDALLAAFDRMIDFCLLIETHAYVTATSHCDMEVVKGMSHQVRNPLTVIGGNIVRLQRKVEPGSTAHRVYETILLENRRLERLVRDAAVYSDLFQKEFNLRGVNLEETIRNALRRLEEMPELKSARVEMALSPELPDVQGDPESLETMFCHLLQNSLEALDSRDPLIRIASRGSSTNETFTQVEITNTGKQPTPEELANLFVPFYSTKPFGTGFGLPIALVVARKSLGDIAIESLPDEGTRCTVTLQASLPFQRT